MGRNIEGVVKMNTDACIIISVVILVILCAGDPDLLDAIIKFVMAKAKCGA